MIQLRTRIEKWPVRGVFAISRGSRTEIEVVVAEIDDGAARGWAECHPYARYGETAAGVLAQVREQEEAVARGLSPGELQNRLPPGAARNVLDCALWDFQAKREGIPVWRQAGIPSSPEPVLSAFTLSVDTPERMAEKAREHADKPLLKVKLAGKGDLERMRAVRAAAPKARLMVDANESWTEALYRELIPELAAMGVILVEQPLPADRDQALRELARPIPLMADESSHDRTSLSSLSGLYDYINIKLDKTGGLTEAVLLAKAAREAGFKLMAGSMLGTSLAMAPAVLLGPLVEFVDLDGPLLLARDRQPPLQFSGGDILPPEPELWG
jgi:L-Ala-D/L-Glu epimerase